MQNRALVLEAHHTTHIEGAHLTLEQLEKLLSGKKSPAPILTIPLRGKATVSECHTVMEEPRRTLQRHLKLLIDIVFAREVGTGPTDPTKYYRPKL